MAKRLVVCCDGTWNFADQPSRTNVAKVALSVRPGSAAGKEQRVYYHSGVGTQRRDRLRGGAAHLRPPGGVAVHRRVVEPRQGHTGDDVAGQHPAVGRVERHVLLGQWREEPRDHRLVFLHGPHGIILPGGG